MNKVAKTIDAFRSWFSYREPEYIPDYEYSPWKKWATIFMAFLALIFFMGALKEDGIVGAVGGLLILVSLYVFGLAIFKSSAINMRRRTIVLIALILLFAGGLMVPPADESAHSKTEASAPSDLANTVPKIPNSTTDPESVVVSTYQVVGVTDGDTIKVSVGGVVETVRIIGMDTPETKDPRAPVQCFGKEASSRMQHYVGDKRVKLENDPSQSDRDKYGRLLRYVYLEDGTNIALQMIKEGFAHEYTYISPHKYQQEFKTAEAAARESGAGLWAANTCNGGTTSVSGDQSPQPVYVAPGSTSTATSVYYANCSEVRDAGAAPIYAGQPGYNTRLDRDGDGIGCE